MEVDETMLLAVPSKEILSLWILLPFKTRHSAEQMSLEIRMSCGALHMRCNMLIDQKAVTGPSSRDETAYALHSCRVATRTWYGDNNEIETAVRDSSN
jgi:hypothetical protein